MYQNGKNIVFIDQSVNSVKAILAGLRHCTPLSTEQEYDLWLCIRQGSKRAFDRLVESNMPYAMRIAKQYLPSGAALEDLFQAGCEGLVIAAHKFDASLGYRFISFATWYVENEVRKAAYDYINHDVTSLDEPIDAENEYGSTIIDNLAAYPSESTDWNLRYYDALNNLKSKMEERQYGLGRLTAELHEMLLKGYTTSDFAHKHRLNETQMKRLLTILREEAIRPLSSAA
jgi:RNA polymerase sigma factor (sigma-70 family)